MTMKPAVALLACYLASAQPLRTIDGDTFTARVAGKIERVRVRNVNTPELGGPDHERAMAAKDFTTAWLAKGDVMLNVCARDRRNRLVAEVSRGGEDLGKELAGAGFAKEYRR